MSDHPAGIVHHLDHFVVPVADADRAQRFYVEVLGGRVLKRMSDPSVTRIFVKVGQNHIGLFSQNKARMPDAKDLKGFPRHGFIASAGDYDNIAAQLRAAGAPVRPIAKGSARGCGAREGVAFADSENNQFELFRGESAGPVRLDHLHFDALDLDESVRFYTHFLKFPLLERDETIAVMGVPGGQSIVLDEVAELSPATKTTYRGRHFAFNVSDDNFHPIVARLQEAGIEQRDEHGEREGRRDEQLATYFKEPSGFRLQITNEDSATFAAHAAK
ncbi:MAG TPA: VOC family protein [Verrucomicrobiae bacterium]|jgi:catechol 2,3-dioxygenase-like lactoylglutathione lyase family enzyme|nr:VOC family protein [Verrucomicrobiae bacterium]